MLGVAIGSRRRVALDAGGGGVAPGGEDWPLECAMAVERALRAAPSPNRRQKMLPGLPRRGAGLLERGAMVPMPAERRREWVRLWGATEAVVFRKEGGRVLWSAQFPRAQAAAELVASALGLEVEDGVEDLYLSWLPVPAISVPVPDEAGCAAAAVAVAGMLLREVAE